MSTILLVDDDEDIRQAYGQLLHRLGHTVDVAEDGHAALERLGHGPVDAILTDLAMPRMDGVAFLRAVRERDQDVPVVMMTGTPSLDSAIRAVELGAFRYLKKPVEPRELVDALDRAVKLHQLARLKRQALAVLGAETGAQGDRAGLEGRFANALRGARPAFQPIVSLSQRKVVAYEALLRTDEKTLARPDHFLAAAERLDRVHELGRVIRGRTAEAMLAARDDLRLFVNLHPLDLNDEQLYAAAAPLARLAGRTVLEVTERASLEGVKDPRALVGSLRKLGFRIAIDDLGAGYAGLSALAQLDPEVVKLDMSLVREVDKSPAKQQIVRAMVSLCRDLGQEIVVEGIETMAERDVLRELGADLMQGYFFARPAFELAEPPADRFA